MALYAQTVLEVRGFHQSAGDRSTGKERIISQMIPAYQADSEFWNLKFWIQTRAKTLVHEVHELFP